MDSNLNFKNKDLRNESSRDVGGGGSLTRQGSIYSLTFDEFQTSLSKDFGSMNMDELLKNIWSVEETQAMAMTSSNGMIPVLGGQGSLTLPRTLSQKTVDQVWKDLSKDGTNLCQSENQRKETLGEVTLEEFLVRAGVVREEAQIVTNNKNGYFGGNDGVEFQQPSPRVVAGLMDDLGVEIANELQVQGSCLPLNVNGVRSTYQQQQQQPIMPRGGVAAIPRAMCVGTLSPVTPLSSDGKGKSNGDSSSLSPSPYMFNGGLRSRKSGGNFEKVVERRQRRMIKNRESAARSRARKQAYTVELEAEVAKLKEEHDELQRKQAKILEMQRNREMEIMKLQGGPKKKLRRIESGPW